MRVAREPPMVRRRISASEPAHRGQLLEVEEHGVEAEEHERYGSNEEGVGFGRECGSVEPRGVMEPALCWRCEGRMGVRVREEEGEEGGAGGENADGLNGVVEAEMGCQALCCERIDKASWRRAC